MKCTKCSKNISLLKFSCKCGNDFCLKCRQPHDHNCIFDFHKENQSKLSQSLPKVIADQVPKI